MNFIKKMQQKWQNINPKKWQDYALKTAIGLMSCVFLYLLTALIFGVIELHADRDKNMRGDVNIYLMTNGVHTDIVMPMQNEVYDWHRVVNPLLSRGGQPAAYVGIGWGSRDFYLNTPTWSDLTPVTALKAATGIGDAAMHITFYPRAPQEHHDSIKISLTAAEYERLIEGILPSFKFDPETHQPIQIPHAFYHDSDVFYEANGHYHLFNTCNTWANSRLKKSGLKAVLWTPFSGSLMNAYRH